MKNAEVIKNIDKVFIPYVTSMFIDFNNTKLKSGTIRHMIIDDKDVIERYVNLDLLNIEVEQLAKIDEVAHRFLQLAIRDIRKHCEVDGKDFNSLVKTKTVSEIARVIEEEDINPRNILSCKAEINRPVVENKLFLNLFKDEYDTEEVTIDFINENVKFIDDHGFEYFNNIFYIVNGYRLK